jgi:hypothetical protein
MFGKQIVQGAAGGMHSAAVTTTGEVACRPPPNPVRFSHGAVVMTTVLAVIFLASSAVPTLRQLFARLTTDEDCEFFPGLAQGLEGTEVVAVAAGDSHTAALTKDGRVFMTGTFRVITCLSC